MRIKNKLKSYSVCAGHVQNLILIFLALSGVALLVSGSLKLGVSTDEPWHTDAAQTFFESGWYMTDHDLEEYNGRELEYLDLYVYGPLQDIISHKVNVILGNEQQNTISYNVAAYEIRHLTTSFIFIFFLALTYLTIYVYTKSHRYSTLSVVILMSIPELVGHSMFSQKDVVVAVGVTLVTYSLFFLSLGKSVYFFLIGITGLILSIGSRPGIWILIVLLIFGYLILNVVYKKPLRLLALNILLIFTKIIVSLFIMQIIYPNLYTDKTNLFKNSLTNSRTYWASHETLTNGRIEKYPLSKQYIPDWLATELPLGILVLFILATIILSSLFFSQIFSKQKIEINILTFLLIIQSFAIPLYTIIFNTNLYSGLRQILFIFPAIGLLIIVAIFRAEFLVKNNVIKDILSFALILYLSFINIEQWRLHPYSYVYLSEIRTFKEVNNSWPTDYWRLSYRELVPKVGADGLAVCNPFLLVEGQHPGGILTGWPQSRDNNCQSDLRFNPFIKDLGRDSELKLKNENQYYYIRSNEFGYNIPDNCFLADEVTRQLRGKKLMLSYVAICEDISKP